LFIFEKSYVMQGDRIKGSVLVILYPIDIDEHNWLKMTSLWVKV